jgi:hypothetical protein
MNRMDRIRARREKAGVTGAAPGPAGLILSILFILSMPFPHPRARGA